MKVAWIHSHFLLWAGGTKFVYEVARRLHGKIHMDMIVEKCSPEIREMFRKENITVTEINSLSSTNPFYWLFFPFFLKRDIARLRALKDRYDTVITSMFPMHYAAAKAAPPSYITYILEPFAFFHDADMKKGFPPAERLLLEFLSFCYKPLDLEGVRKASQIMTINQGTASWVKEIYGRESIPSYLGVDTDFFRPKNDSIKTKYEGRKTVIHSTDFTPLKKTWDAVKAVEMAREDIPEIKLLITWSSGNQREIQKLRAYLRRHGLEGHIELVGFVAHHELPSYYSAADISLYTGIGRGASAASLFVLECMACGTPGVRTAFTRDEIEHGVSGFLYEPGDTRGLKQYLIRLLTDDPLRRRFAEAARRRVLEKYQWDEVAKRFLEVIIQSSRRPKKEFAGQHCGGSHGHP